MRGLPIMIVLGTLLSLSLAGAIADDTNHEKPPPPQVRRIYDVTDLAAASPVDPATTSVLPPTDLNTGRTLPARTGGGGGLFGGGAITGPEKPHRVSDGVDALIKLIQEGIEPNMWRDNGGSDAFIRAFGSRLVISATAATHAQIAELLADLRKNQNRCVRRCATWAALSDEELKSVTIQTPVPGKDSGARIVNLTAIEKIKGAIHYQTEINVLTGQPVNVTAGRARSIISSMDAVIGNGAAALQPNIDLLLSGTALQIAPILSADGATVRLDIRAVASSWDPPDAAPMKIPGPVATTQPRSPADANQPPTVSGPPVEIERANIPVHYLTTTTRIPTGQPVLIGGMATNIAEKDARQLYLIIEATGEK
jgi:hypothetical protein